MIKRDPIQKINFVPVEDEQGGNSIDKQYGETIKAMVSQNTTYGQMTQYGVKEEIILNVVVDNKLASRHHALIQKIKNVYFLKDVGSTNGTFLNGTKIPSDKYVKLMPGDKITIGNMSLVIS